MKDVNKLHTQYCPAKNLENFWRSKSYKVCARILKTRNIKAKIRVEYSAKDKTSSTMVHPLVAFEFIRWADPDKAYDRLYKALFDDH